MSTIDLAIPDIGDFGDVEVIEILVAEGDTIAAEQSLITVESDKASMEIPAERGGVVKAVLVKLGDKVSQGTPRRAHRSASGRRGGAERHHHGGIQRRRPACGGRGTCRALRAAGRGRCFSGRGAATGFVVRRHGRHRM